MADQLSTAITQYGILENICKHLSGKDTIHLAATSKANYSSIASRPATLKRLLAHGLCNSRTGSHCLATEGKPCNDCGALVCDPCRFHLDSGSGTTHEERLEQEQLIVERIDKDGMIRPNDHENVRRAFETIQNNKRWCCADCHPLVMPGENDWQRCQCGVYDRFVGKKWLCVPCFGIEERKAKADAGKVMEVEDVLDKVEISGKKLKWYMRPSKKTASKKAGSRETVRDVTVRKCDSGKDAVFWSFQMCRACNGVVWSLRYWEYAHVLPRIEAQLS